MRGLDQKLIDEAGYLAKGGRLLQRFVAAKPFLCNWQITYRCNFTCDICTFWRQPHSSSEELTAQQISEIGQKLKPLAPLIISVAGGEPLLRRDLPEITRALSRDHYFTLITNGWLMTRPLARSLYEAGLQDIHVSIDYADASKHDAQRRREGAFRKAIEAVEILRDARPDRRHRVHIMGVLLDDNVDQIEGLVLLARELGVSFELSLYSHRRGRKPARLPRQKVSAMLRDLKSRYPATFVSLDDYLANFDRAIENDGLPDCHAGLTFFNLDHRGGVSRCIDNSDKPAGNLLVEPLEAVLERLRGQGTIDPCGGCYTTCRAFGDMLPGIQGLARLPGFLNMVRPL